MTINHFLLLPHHIQHGVGDKFRFVTFCFQYVTYLGQLVLSVIPGSRSKRPAVSEVW